MASPFSQYQGGIQPVTGMAEAGANIGRMYQQGISQLGEAIGKGIQVYGENQKKSEMADATIASGVARFKAMADIYAQDPEFAPVVAGFAQRLAQYQDAPNQSLSKKLVMANDINMLGQDLAQTIQAQQVIRGRQVERVGGELLNQFKDVDKVTDPTFIRAGVSQLNTGKDYLSNEGEFLAGLNRFRDAAKAAGKEIKGTDAEALDAYRRDVLDSTNKAMSAGTLDPAVGSRILEQVEAQRNIERQNALAKSDMPVLPSMAKSSRKAYESVTSTAYQAPEQAAVDDRVIKAYAPFKAQVTDELKSLKEREAALKTQADVEQRASVLTAGKTPIEKTAENAWNNFAVPALRDTLKKYSKVDENGEVTADWGKMFRDAGAMAYAGTLGPIGSMLIQQGAFDAEKPLPERVKIAKSVEEQVKKTGTTPELMDIQSRIRGLETTLNGIQQAETQKPTQETPKAPVVSLGKIPVGSVEYERKVSIAEKKAKIADLMTQRIGTVDPVTGKKTLPVGFDSWFKQMVPESDARVVDVDGVKLLWDGKKFEQVKPDKAMTMKEIRENQIGVYGKQTPDGGLAPEEFIPNSGVYLSGIFRGSDSADAAFRDEQEKLIDARRSVKVLQGINDKFGEALNLKDKGIATVELMNLKAALRRDIVGVGQVSNYEQKLIEEVIADPTAFLSFEAKDRAILLALAERVDRKIVSNATKFGLQVTMKGQEGESRYASLRQKYLAEKSK